MNELKTVLTTATTLLVRQQGAGERQEGLRVQEQPWTWKCLLTLA